MRGETHFISGPAIGDERCRQPAMFGQDVARKIAPDMVATKAVALLDEHDFQFGPHFGKRKCNKSTGKTAADYRKITFYIFSVHPPALAQPFYKGKGCPKEIHSFLRC